MVHDVAPMSEFADESGESLLVHVRQRVPDPVISGCSDPDGPLGNGVGR